MTSMPMGSMFASGGTPPWLPREVAEGRRYGWWAQIMFFLATAAWFVLAIISLTMYAVNDGQGWLATGVFGLIAMVMCFLSAVFLKKTVIDAIDQGRFHDARNDSIIWVIFGLIGFILPALFLILAYAKLSDALAAQQPTGYVPYQQGAVAVQQPTHVPPPAPIQQQGAPPAQPAQPAQPYHAHATPMLRCKNCNVQFPTFMHSCPNCGAPKEEGPKA